MSGTRRCQTSRRKRCAGALLSDGATWSCFQGAALFCFETGRTATVAPAPAPAGARLGFVTRGARTQPGLAAMDALCTTEATAAALPGTYRAAVATSTASVTSRFTLDDRPWHRPDGTLVARGAELFTPLTDQRSFFNQHADGGYTGARIVSGGQQDPTVVARLQARVLCLQE